MIKTYGMLLNNYANYQFPTNKIMRMVNNGTYIKLTKGLYKSNPNIPGYLLANAIYLLNLLYPTMD